MASSTPRIPAERPPRILCMMQLPPPVHGASVVNQQVANSALLVATFDLELLPLRFADSIASVGKASPMKVARATGVAARLAWTLLTRRPAAVYFTLSPVGGAFYRDCVYVGILKAFRVPRIYHMHGKGIAKRVRSRLHRKLYRWVFDDAWVIHLSPLLAHDLDGVMSTGRMLFVPNGVPDKAPPVIAKAARRPGPPRILFLSNMIETKGPLLLVEALGALKAEGGSFEATFAGAASGDACLDAFHAAVSRLQLADRVRYVGPAYADAKADLFRDHDIFAFPTFYPNEAFPLVLLEAMQWRLPVISTREGAIPDIIDEHVTGLLTEPKVGSLTAALRTLLADPARWPRMGELGRSHYLAHFTSERFEQNLVAALKHCLGTAA